MIAEKISKITGKDAAFCEPLIIAEVGVNHEGSMEVARRLIEEAATGGADAVKFQTYRADTLASVYSPAYWDVEHEPTTTQHALFSKYDSFWKNEFEILKTYCDQCSVEFMSTPFDSGSAKFLNDLMGVFKISSSDITNRPFIEEIASFGKPIILSTGASTCEEISEALTWIDKKEVPTALMHCILSYPTLDKDANLGMIRGLRNRYPERIIGYSDHTMPGDLKNLMAATALGAEIIEKHFTHDKRLPGNDHYHAMDLDDLKLLRKQLTELTQLIGETEKKPMSAELAARKHARRSLVASRALPTGTRVGIDDLTWKRPGHGISPKYLNHILGMRLKVGVEKDEVLDWENLE